VRAAIYARVSTVDQNCELQRAELAEYLRRHGWENAGDCVASRGGQACAFEALPAVRTILLSRGGV
jgi:DNA invertase Pin-like site-specific DNA recombinase